MQDALGTSTIEIFIMHSGQPLVEETVKVKLTMIQSTQMIVMQLTTFKSIIIIVIKEIIIIK